MKHSSVQISAPKLSKWVLPADGGYGGVTQVQSPIGATSFPSHVTLRTAGEDYLDGAFIARRDVPVPGRLPFREVAGVTSKKNLPDSAPRVKMLHISGIDTNALEHSQQLHRLADGFAESGVRAELVGMHNGTDGKLRDLAQATADVLTCGRGHNQCIGNLRDQIVHSVNSRERLNVFAHSQGAIILSRALTEAKTALILEHGHTRGEAFAAIAKYIRGATYGGATASFTNEVLHFYNPKDFVASTLGVGLRDDVPSGTFTWAGKLLAPAVGLLRKLFHTEPLAPPIVDVEGDIHRRGQVELVDSKVNGLIESHRAKTYAESMNKGDYTRLSNFFSSSKPVTMKRVG